MQSQRAEARGTRQDRAVMKDNWAVANRIQTGIMRIGEGLNRDNLRYDWWKVRYINSNFCWPPILLLEAFFSQT
jgi:hypothetical protein